MIVDRGGADVQSVGNAPGRAAFSQEAKNLDLSYAKIALARRRARSDHRHGVIGGQACVADHEIADHHLQPLAQIHRADDVNCIDVC